MSLALGALALTTTLVNLLAAVLLVAGPVEPSWVVLAFPIVAELYMLAAVTAWWRRPSNRVGPILLLGGWSMLLGGLINTDAAALIAIGQITGTLVLAVIAHLVVVYPSGRTTDRRARVLVVLVYLTSLVLQIPLYLLAPAPAASSPLQVTDAPGLVDVFTWVQRIAGLAIVFAIAAHVRHRVGALPRATRRVVAPVAWYGLVAIVVLPLSAWVGRILGIDPIARFVFQSAVLAVVPLAFALGVLVGGFARTGNVVELGEWLAASRRRSELGDVLAETLGDPSVELVFWLPARGAYVDVNGNVVTLPDDDDVGRRWEPIDIDARHLGAIIYDPSVIADASAVRTAGRVIAFAIERERLVADLTASRDELRESRARVVAASDRERRRISQDLHDGVQSRLVFLAILAQQLVDRVDDELRDDALAIRTGLDTAIDELRQLVHGVLPALLVERGLAAATTDLLERTPVPTVLDADEQVGRLPPAVETAAYFFVAESLTNAVKHADASCVEVRIDHVDGELLVEVRDDGIGAAAVDGAGLDGLGDRFDALGGRLLVDSRPGHGTSVRAAVPCGS